jgi:hypothetical protein
MGFDKKDGGSIIEPAKKTTQVNIFIVLAVVVFILIGCIAMVWVKVFRG